LAATRLRPAAQTLSTREACTAHGEPRLCLELAIAHSRGLTEAEISGSSAGLASTQPGTIGRLNDLWKFDGSNWTWSSGTNVVLQPGVRAANATGQELNNNLVGTVGFSLANYVEVFQAGSGVEEYDSIFFRDDIGGFLGDQFAIGGQAGGSFRGCENSFDAGPVL
jgi:hypothetical protein